MYHQEVHIVLHNYSKCDWAVNDIFDINGLVFDMKFVVKSVAKTSVPSWSPTVYDSVSIWLPALLRILHLRLNVPWPSTVHWYCTVCDRHTETVTGIELSYSYKYK